MTINLQHFDTKRRQDMDVHEQIKNSIAEYLFPETEYALGMMYKGGAHAHDLREYQGKTLQFANRERLYFASQSIRDLLYPNPSDGAAYGSLPFTPNQSFLEKKDLRILIIDDVSGKNGEVMPFEDAKKLVGDCYGKISKELASELTDSSNTPFQFRIGIKPQAENEFYRIAKGTLAPDDLNQLIEPYFRSGKNQTGELQTKHGYDMILPTSSFKGRKYEVDNAIEPGEYVLTLGIGVKSLAKYGSYSLSTQVLVNYPRGVQADLLPELKNQAVNLAKAQSEPRLLAQLYVEKYERRQSLIESSEAEVESDLASLSSAIEEAFGDEETESPEQKKQDELLYRLLKADLDGHSQILEHPKVIDGLNKFVRKEWVNIATGRAIKFNSGLAQPAWDLAKDQICVPTIPEGKEIIVTRSPLVNSNGVIVLTNKHLPEVKDQQGTIHIHPDTAAQHLQADFDGDVLAFEVATKYPTLAAEVKEYNLKQNRYPNVVKANKVAYTGSFEDVAISASENKIGLIANQISRTVALQWETQLVPAEEKQKYLNNISKHYRSLLKDDADPSQDIKIPSHFKDRIEKLAKLPRQPNPQKVDQLLGEVKKLLFDTVSELSNELQVAVDGPKSVARPNETVINYCKAISNYTYVDWLADKKNPEAFLDREMYSNNYSSIDLMVQQTNKFFNESRLTARPVFEFKPLFQGVACTTEQETYAREISKKYNAIIREAISLKGLVEKAEGPTLIATSTASGKQIEITDLLKFDKPSSPIWTQSNLDIKLYENIDDPLAKKLEAVVVSDSENNPIKKTIGSVSEKSVREHNLTEGVRIYSADISITPVATMVQVEAKFQEAAKYLDDIRQNTPESEQLSLAAAIWKVNHTHSDNSNPLKKAGVAFNTFPELVLNQLSNSQFHNLTVVGIHHPTNEFLGKKWQGEKVQGAIAKDTDEKSPNYGKTIVVLEGKKFAPLQEESPTLPVGTQFEASVLTQPGAGVIATTRKGNSIKIKEIKNHDFANQEWSGEPAQIQVGLLPSGDPSLPTNLVALVDDKVLGVLDKESIKKLTSANLHKPGATLNVSLVTTPSTTASVKIDPQSIVYPHQLEKVQPAKNEVQLSQQNLQEVIKARELSFKISQVTKNLMAALQTKRVLQALGKDACQLNKHRIESQGNDLVVCQL